MKNTLAPIPTCITCQMELTAFIDREGEKLPAPKEYCDGKCREMWKLYEEHFLIGRRNYTLYTGSRRRINPN